jgi:putative phage-type endonuclease
VDQNSNEWLDWRDNSIGSSEAGIIMGVSEYQTPYELWLQRTGRKKADQEKFAFAIGHRFEPILREKAEQRLGEIYEPQNIRSKDYPFMHASVDGQNLEGNSLMEIKLNNADVHAMVKAKAAIPEYHMCQMQHQLLVTGADKCYYISGPHSDEPETIEPDELAIIPVYPSKAYFDDLLIAEGAFVEHLANDEPPELVERDGVQMKSASWKRNAAEYNRLQKKIDAIKKQQDRVKDRLKEMAGDHSVARGYGICVKNTLVKGRVLYQKIPELKDVELDQYRTRSYIKTTYSEDK